MAWRGPQWGAAVLALGLGLACSGTGVESAVCPDAGAVSVQSPAEHDDLTSLLENLQTHYVYATSRGVDFDCLERTYRPKYQAAQTRDERVLVFETLLLEFWDSHMILNTNTDRSFRLYAPLRVELSGPVAEVAQLWSSQLKTSAPELLGARVSALNGVPLAKAIAAFPTRCLDTTNPQARTWIVNKLLAGRYHEPRALTLTSSTGGEFVLDLDRLETKTETELLTQSWQGTVGVIRINDSLGRGELISAFDRALDQMQAADAIVLDLRNTISGGDSYVARGILGRFVQSEQPYQKHRVVEREGDHPAVVRSWIEYVSPRGTSYLGPTIALVGPWTGSMGEGLAIGLEGIGRGPLFGAKMAGLAGAVSSFSFEGSDFGYQMPTEDLLHIDGTPRHEYRPSHLIEPVQLERDPVLDAALAWLREVTS